ncbi:MAG: mannitol dehydrogenase family protein, partial [Peptostreptococcaceae bacterium]|nr:mannitol dehydrogenase family protein [Peptostreptococcaceae bacterium]
VINVRLPNPYIPDMPQRIATDTSQKVGIRFGETIKSYIKSDDKNVSDLKYIPLVLAGWLRYLLAIDDKGNKFDLSPDPLLSELSEYMQDIKIGQENDYNKIRKLLENERIFGVNLVKNGLDDLIIKYLDELTRKAGSVRITLEKYLGGQ